MPISKLESQINEFGLIRCHRSYIMNPDKVIQVSGNAQGLKLELSNKTYQVPVSRKYIPEIKAVLD